MSEKVKIMTHWQCWDSQSFTVRRDGGDTRCDTNTDVVELTELLHHGIDLLATYSLRVKNGLCIVKDDKHFLGG